MTMNKKKYISPAVSFIDMKTCGIMEIQITGTCLTEQVLRDDTAYRHGFRVLVEQPHQLFATHP